MTDTTARPTLTDQALEELHRQHARPLFRYILGLTFGDRHIAEDIAQEVLLRAWQWPDLMTDRPSQTRSWLFTVARNLSIDRLRRRQARPREDGDVELDAVPDTCRQIDQVASSLTLRAALAQLTPARREVLIELYYHDRSLKDVAASLDIAVGTVKSRVYYALRALRAVLDEQSTSTELLEAA